MSSNTKVFYSLQGNDLHVKTIREFCNTYAERYSLDEEVGVITESFASSRRYLVCTAPSDCMWEILFALAIKKASFVYPHFIWDYSAKELARCTSNEQLLKAIAEYEEETTEGEENGN